VVVVAFDTQGNYTANRMCTVPAELRGDCLTRELGRAKLVHERVDLSQIFELLAFDHDLVADLDDHVVIDGRAVFTLEPALADAALVPEHARIGLAEPAVAVAALARHRFAQLGDRRRHRIEIEALSCAVEAHRLPLAEQLHALQEASALLGARAAARTGADRASIYPAAVTAPAAAAPQLGDRGVADFADTGRERSGWRRSGENLHCIGGRPVPLRSQVFGYPGS